MKPYLLILFLIVSYNCLAQRYSCKTNEIKSSEINEKVPAIKLLDDIDEFIKILEEVHVNPYMKISKEEFYNAAIELKNSINDSLTRQQFYQVFTPLVDLLNDSHSGVKFPSGIWRHYQYEANGLFFPMEIETTLDKRIFIKRDFSKNNIPEKTEIKSINSVKSEDIINIFLKYEHSPIEKSSIKRLERKFVDFIWWILDFKGPYTVETNIGTYTVDGQKWEAYLKNWESLSENNNLSSENIVLKEVDTSTCILKINSYSGSISEFKIQIKEQFKKIQENGCENLIIDVRDNGGGNDGNGRTVIDFITDKPYSEALASTFMMKRSKRYEKYQKCKAPWIIRWLVNLRTVSWFNKKTKKLFKALLETPRGENLIVDLPLTEPTENPYRFKGNVFVLSNYNSYSATTVFLGAAKDYKLGTIIGTETGDCPTGFGNNLYFELKNSRLRCHSSTTFMIRPNGNTDMSHGVIPDYNVEQSIEDTENNEDTILNFTLDLIEKTKHNILYK
ncbi:S41 family peptidase [Ancylomarina sp.]|uniref:S41 family peptidase n=1 Tax=Ancylomarina sp. TaxID=1970196 RepID=UPI003561C40B